jgi:dihydropyrimidinase
VIAPGGDADLVLWDPDAEHVLTIGDLHHDGDYSPWEGWAVIGRPVTTLLRGRVIVEAGRLVGEPNGRFVPRKADPALLSAPVV